RIGPAEARLLVPALRDTGEGAWLSWDGQLVDDARLVVALARTAAGLGARILTRCRAVTVAADGALVHDTVADAPVRLRARAVVNAAGVWAGGLVDGITLRPSRGSHVVLPASALGDPRGALTVPIGGSMSRYAFALPQPGGLVYLGITDEPVEGSVPDVPEPTETEIGFLLDVLNSALDTPVRRDQVLGAYAGLRPLLDDGRHSGADLSRRHAVLTSPSGVVTIVGGKLTTYRAMAADAVDTAVKVRTLAAGPSRTASLPLVGAGPVPPGAPPRLVARYGSEAAEVLACGDPEPVADGVPVSPAELRWGVLHEGALDVDDLLDRRTRVGLVPSRRAMAEPAARAALRH
ncbi:glycerol-3-phosphate dehydrogenase/oxidase, partial [Pseudonocardia benzenivorans]